MIVIRLYGYLYVDHEELKLKKLWFKITGWTLYNKWPGDDLHFKVFDISGCFFTKVNGMRKSTHTNYFPSIYHFSNPYTHSTSLIYKKEINRFIRFIIHWITDHLINITRRENHRKESIWRGQTSIWNNKGNVVAIMSIFQIQDISIQKDVDVLT